MRRSFNHPLRTALATMLIVLLAACANPAIKEGSALIDQGQWPAGLARMEQGMQESPDDYELRMQYFRYREAVVLRAMENADADIAAGRLDIAEAGYRQVIRFDAKNSRAADGLTAVAAARRHIALLDEAKLAIDQDDMATAAQHVKTVLTENPSHTVARAFDRELREREQRRSMTPPQLKGRLQNTVNLEFRDAPLKLVLEALSRSSGVNFVFDREVRPELKTTIVARDVRVEDAVDMILAQNQLEKKVLSENAVLVYPNTPQKLRENQELVMRAFHLGNADVKQTVNLLRTMVKTKDMFVDERMNMIVMRDTPDVIRIAEKLIGMHDLVDPEVVLEIEILEVSRNKVRDLGVTFPNQFSGPGGTLETIRDISSATTNVNSGFAITALRTDGDTKTLANPRVRVRNKEKARVHVGDRVPVISSTLVGTGSGAPVSSEQIQYLDVGIKVELEPTVHPDNTVAVKINLDVSSLGAQTRTTLGSVAYEVGTRNVTTVLRLGDGETQALMGLIRDDESQTRTGIPFLGELPILDRIFGSTKDDRRSRELVLLITPRIVRGNAPTDSTLAEFWSGTEARMRAQAPFAISADAALPARTVAGSTAAAQTPAGNGVRANAAGPAAAAAAGTEVLRAPVLNMAPASMVLSWTKPEGVRADTEFAVSLNAKGEGPVKGVTVSLRYRPTELELIAVEDGGYFKRGGLDGSFTPKTETGLGIIVATLGAAGESVEGGEGSLLTLRFKPLTSLPKSRIEYITVLGVDAANRQIPISGMSPLEVLVQQP